MGAASNQPKLLLSGITQASDRFPNCGTVIVWGPPLLGIHCADVYFPELRVAIRRKEIAVWGIRSKWNNEPTATINEVSLSAERGER